MPNRLCCEMKTIRLIFYALLIPAVATVAHAQKFTSSSGEFLILNMEEWEVKEGGDKAANGNAQLLLHIPDFNLHADLKLTKSMYFDVTSEKFAYSTAQAMKKAGAKVICTNKSKLLGKDSLDVFAVRQIPKEGEDQLIYFVTKYAYMHTGKLLTLTISDDTPDVNADEWVKFLIKNLLIRHEGTE